MRFGRAHVIEKTPALDTNAYATGDSVGGVQELGALPADFGRGVLKSLVVTDGANQGAALDVYLFNSQPTAGVYTDNGGAAPTAADMARCVGYVSIGGSDWNTLGTCKVVVKEVAFVARSEQTTVRGNKFYYLIVSRGSPTYAADSLTLKFGFLSD